MRADQWFKKVVGGVIFGVVILVIVRTLAGVVDAEIDRAAASMPLLRILGLMVPSPQDTALELLGALLIDIGIPTGAVVVAHRRRLG